MGTVHTSSGQRQAASQQISRVPAPSLSPATSTMATDLVPGKWQLTESDNFENFMAALGIGYLTRKLGNQSKPLVTISHEGGEEWIMKQESLVKTTEGRKVLTTNTVVGPNTL